MMFKNYLKIALRSLRKNKVYTLINTLGLSVGLACCVLILLYVQDEFSYDNFLEDEENIYRLAVERIYPDHVSFFAITPSGFSNVFAEEIPEVEKSTRLVGYPNSTDIVEYDDKVFEENYVFFADSSFFEVFNFEVIQGNKSLALSEPWSVVLTQSTAEKYFGSENPIGKTIEIDDSLNTVTAVMQDVPENSHLQFDFLSSSSNQPDQPGVRYIGFTTYTYLKLTDGTPVDAVESKIDDIVIQYASGQIESRLGTSYEEYREAGNGYNYFLQPITDIHLHSNFQNEIKPNGNITYVYIFMSIAVFILIIACINFVNLATARSGERALEVGIRKVMGSERIQLIRQFLTESVMLSLFSLLLAILVIQAVLPFYNSLAGKELSLNLFGNGLIICVLVGFTIFVGLLAGIYPALYISSLKPVQVMKGKFLSNLKGRWLRNGLVVLQFSISIVLISGTLVVNDQMNFIQSKSLGFDKENVLVIENMNNLDQRDAFKQTIRGLADVQSTGGTEVIPGGAFFGIQLQQPGIPEVLTSQRVAVDDNYIETLNINLLEGRSFSEDFNDSLNVILNEAAVQAFGISDPIGKQVRNIQQEDGESITVTYEIIGVVEDFNYESLRTNITPLVMVSSESAYDNEGFLTVRFSSLNFSDTISEIEGAWNSFFPDRPFSYYFLDDNLEQMYSAEQASGRVFAVFAFIAIVIACVGLFGLAAYTSYQRKKEIGVRKVLGATVPGIVFLLSKNFAKLVGVAFLVAGPIAYFFMQNWLQNFAYRVDLGFFTIFLAGLIALTVALLTISYQAISAAIVNPVESLRSE